MWIFQRLWAGITGKDNEVFKDQMERHEKSVHENSIYESGVTTPDEIEVDLTPDEPVKK